MVSRSDLRLVVSILFLVYNDLFQTLIADLFVISKHLLQFCVEVLSFVVPDLFFRFVDLLLLLHFLLGVSLVSLKMLVLTG